MTGADLDEVRAASARERQHHDDHVEMGCTDPVCYCPRCTTDRATIAAHAPAMLELIDDARKHGGES